MMLCWIYFLAMVCILLDPELTRAQKIGQTVFAIIVPIIGPVFVLYIVNTHSPEVIKRLYLPWPLRDMIIGEEKIRYKSDTDHDDYIEPNARKRSSQSDDFSD